MLPIRLSIFSDLLISSSFGREGAGFEQLWGSEELSAQERATGIKNSKTSVPVLCLLH